MKVSAIYTRQSLDKKESLSIEAQTEKCINLCKYKDKQYQLYSDKGFSGKNMERPDFNRMLEDIKKGLIDEVVVYRVDRISRNLNDFTAMIAEFEKYGVSFASTSESFDTSSPMGRAMMYLLLIFAQLERETIAERIKDNAMYRATLGRFTGGVVPFGYDKVRINENGISKALLVPNEEQSKIVKQIFDWYNGEIGTVRGIVYKLNMLGIKTKEGKEFGQSTVSRLLQNVIYAKNSEDIYNYFKENDLNLSLINDLEQFDGQLGMMFYRKRGEDVKRRKGLKEQEQFVIISEHQGIIDGSDWVNAQQKLESNKRSFDTPRAGKITILTGLVKCGICGSTMTSWWSQNQNGVKFEYMKCRRKLMKGKFLCASKSIRINELEKEVIEKIIKFCSNRKKIEKMLDKARINNDLDIMPIEKQIHNINKRIKEKEIEIENLINNLKNVSNEFLTKQIEKEINKINTEIYQYRDELKNIQEKYNYLAAKNIDKEYLMNNFTSFPKAFKMADFEEKKVLIRSIVKEIIATNDDVEIVYFN